MKKLISIILVLSMILLYNVNNFQQIKDYIVDELEDKQISDNKVDINQIYNFKRINIGDSKESVIEKLSNPNRIDKTPYNFFWYVYNTYKESCTKWEYFYDYLRYYNVSILCLLYFLIKILYNIQGDLSD